MGTGTVFRIRTKCSYLGRYNSLIKYRKSHINAGSMGIGTYSVFVLNVVLKRGRNSHLYEAGINVD
jgi:hypothetical protein